MGFPIGEGRDDNFRGFRVRVMHGLGIVTERLLREALRITALQRAFGPRVPVRVKRYTFDVQPFAALFEFGSAISRPDGA